MTLHAPDVSLTDFLIAVLCLYFSLRIWWLKGDLELRKLFIGVFLSVGTAALAGGLYHGFFEVTESVWSRVSWKAVMFAIGCAAFYLWHVGAHLGLPYGVRRWLSPLLQFALLAYALYVAYVNQSFLVAITAYLPAVLFLTVILVIRFCKTKDSRMLIGLLGILLTIAAAVVQTQKIALHPDYFNHNALYHSIQALGLYFIYRFAIRIAIWN